MSNDSDQQDGGLPGGLGQLLERARGLQSKMSEIQAELASKTVVGEAGGGMVRVTANGRQQIVAVEIEPEVLNSEERDMLQDLIVAATNHALEAAQRMMREELVQATGGLSIPGLF